MKYNKMQRSNSACLLQRPTPHSTLEWFEQGRWHEVGFEQEKWHEDGLSRQDNIIIIIIIMVIFKCYFSGELIALS